MAVSFDEEGGEAGEAGGVTTEAAGGANECGDVGKGGREGDLVDEFVLVQRAAEVEGAAIERVRGHGEWHVFGGAFGIGGGGAIETFEDVFDAGVDGGESGRGDVRFEDDEGSDLGGFFGVADPGAFGLLFDLAVEIFFSVDGDEDDGGFGDGGDAAGAAEGAASAGVGDEGGDHAGAFGGGSAFGGGGEVVIGGAVVGPGVPGVGGPTGEVEHGEEELVAIEGAVFVGEGAGVGGEGVTGVGLEPVEELAIAGAGGEVGVRAVGGAGGGGAGPGGVTLNAVVGAGVGSAADGGGEGHQLVGAGALGGIGLDGPEGDFGLIEGVGLGGAAVGGEAEASAADVGLVEGITGDGLEAIALAESTGAVGLTGVEEELVDV